LIALLIFFLRWTHHLILLLFVNFPTLLSIKILAPRFKMRSTLSAGLFFALVAEVYGHGVVTSIQGANGVDMPGLSGQCLPNI
jgi:hypothetical protein